MGKVSRLARSTARSYIMVCGEASIVARLWVAWHGLPAHSEMPRMTTSWVDIEAIGSYFQSLPDPRHTRNRKHLLLDIVAIAVCGMVCGCDGPTAIHRWATQRHAWLQSFLPLAHGIPSRDCIRR